jgi:hypothetical protein
MNQHKATPIERKTLRKERFSSGTHTYFLELKETLHGSKYVVIDQRRKVGEEYESAKIRIFEDELLEFQRVLDKLIRTGLTEDPYPIQVKQSTIVTTLTSQSSDLSPAFFNKLLTTNAWREFEQYTHYLLKLIGIQAAYTFLGERQAGKADGFFKIGNLAVLYDCTLDDVYLEDNKKEQVMNYCNRLRQGSLELKGRVTTEFYQHHKQVWIITRSPSRRLKLINEIEIKQINIQDLIAIYHERLYNNDSDEYLETKLKNL